MCECGCGNFNPQYKLQGPKGILYGISVYPGCNDCDTPAGVVISRLTKSDECFYDELKSRPELEFWEATNDFAIPIIEQSVVLESYKDWLGETDVAEYEPEGLLEEFLQEKFSEIVCQTYEKFEQECIIAKQRLSQAEDKG